MSAQNYHIWVNQLIKLINNNRLGDDDIGTDLKYKCEQAALSIPFVKLVYLLVYGDVMCLGACMSQKHLDHRPRAKEQKKK